MKTLQRHIYISLLCLAVLIPRMSSAMSIEVTPLYGEAHIEDSSLVKVTIDTDGREINVVDGTITFDNARVISASTGGSIFELWPQLPTVTNGNSISFAGGTPSAVFGKTLRLFTIAITPQSEQPITARITNAHAYLHDGSGSPIPIPDATIEIPVVAQPLNENTLTTSIELDTVPPKPFTITIGREAATFDGKYFASFYTTDGETGVVKYVVTENGTTTETTSNTYVLRDQSRSTDIIVKALDAAGNERIGTLSSTQSSSNFPLLVYLILCGSIALALSYYFIRRKK